MTKEEAEKLAKRKVQTISEYGEYIDYYDVLMIIDEIFSETIKDSIIEL